MLKNDIVAYGNDAFSWSRIWDYPQLFDWASGHRELLHIGSKSSLRRKCCTSSSEATVLGWSDVVHWFSDMLARFCTCLWTASELHHFDSIEPDNCTLMLPAIQNNWRFACHLFVQELDRLQKNTFVSCPNMHAAGFTEFLLCGCRSQSTSSKVGPLRSLCRRQLQIENFVLDSSWTWVIEEQSRSLRELKQEIQVQHLPRFLPPSVHYCH